MDSKILRFKIVIEPDLSDASLHLINISEITEDFLKSLSAIRGGGYRICDDALVYLWDTHYRRRWGVYIGLTSAPFTNVVTKWDGYYDSLSLCPASGRFIYANVGSERCKLVVADLF